MASWGRPGRIVVIGAGVEMQTVVQPPNHAPIHIEVIPTENHRVGRRGSRLAR